jgi:hypothetical protein
MISGLHESYENKSPGPRERVMTWQQAGGTEHLVMGVQVQTALEAKTSEFKSRLCYLQLSTRGSVSSTAKLD